MPKGKDCEWMWSVYVSIWLVWSVHRTYMPPYSQQSTSHTLRPPTFSYLCFARSENVCRRGVGSLMSQICAYSLYSIYVDATFPHAGRCFWVQHVLLRCLAASLRVVRATLSSQTTSAMLCVTTGHVLVMNSFHLLYIVCKIFASFLRLNRRNVISANHRSASTPATDDD